MTFRAKSIILITLISLLLLSLVQLSAAFSLPDCLKEARTENSICQKEARAEYHLCYKSVNKTALTRDNLRSVYSECRTEYKSSLSICKNDFKLSIDHCKSKKKIENPQPLPPMGIFPPIEVQPPATTDPVIPIDSLPPVVIFPPVEKETCPSLRDSIKEEFNSINYCTTNDDCTLKDAPSLPCGIFPGRCDSTNNQYNKNANLTLINSLIKDYINKSCSEGCMMVACIPQSGNLKCIKNKCTFVPEDKNILSILD